MFYRTILFLISFNIFKAKIEAQNNFFTVKDTAFASRLLSESAVLNGKEKYELAFAKADSAQQIFEQALGKETILVSNALLQKGVAKRRLNLFDEAIALHEQSLAIRLKVFGKMHPLVALSYNLIGGAYRLKGDFKKALEYLLIAANIRENVLEKGHRDILLSYNNLGDVYLSDNDYEKSLDYNTRALNILLKYQPTNAEYIAHQNGNIGMVYNAMGQYNKARGYLEKVLTILVKILPPDNVGVALAYDNLGVLYNNLGDYNAAIEHFYKALNIYMNKPLTPLTNPESAFRNLGTSYLYKGEYNKAIEHFRKSLDILSQKKITSHPMYSDIYTDIGLAYLRLSKTDSAIYYMQNALDSYLKTETKENLNVTRFYTNLGMGYSQKKEFDVALDFFQKSLKLKSKVVGIEHPFVTSVLKDIGSVYFNKKDYNKAIEYLNKALLSEHYQKKMDLSLINNKYNITEALKTFSLLYFELYQNTKNVEKLKQAADYAEQAIENLGYHEESLNTEGSKLYLKNSAYDIYEMAIRTKYRLYVQNSDAQLLETSLNYAEQSKAKSLQSQIKSTYALNFSGIPDSLIQEEISLKESIVFYEKKRQEKLEEGKSETDSTILAISSILFDLKQKSEDLKKDFGREYPDYYKLKYELSTLNIKDIQQKILNPDQTLLEYFVGDSSIFIFTINQQDFEVLEVKRDFDLNGLVNLMRKGIQDYHTNIKSDSLRNASPINYTEGASKLYQKLIAPIKGKLKKNIIIVPDDVLNYIPFEALLIKQDVKPFRFNAHTYLLNEHNISYAYSATMLKEMMDKKHKQEPNEVLLGMAPFFSGDTTLSPDILTFTETTRDTLKTLPSSGQEIANITKLMKGIGYYGKDATIKKFTQIAPQYRILHLATHGKANNKLGDYSYLAFYNTKDSLDMRLYVRDLYNLNLNADMVVLSACETGIGELQRGEGIISLARAFSYAGAKSIITTLWQIGDEKSKILMTDFYKYLRKGQTKEQALSNAKRDFIKKTDSDPFFWAGFIGIGDMTPLKK